MDSEIHSQVQLLDKPKCFYPYTLPQENGSESLALITH